MAVQFEAENREQLYGWVDRTLREQDYEHLVRQSKGRSWHRSLPIFDDYGCLSTRRHGRSFSQNGANLRGPTSRPSNGDSSSKRANPIDDGTSLRSRDLAYHPCGMP